MADLLLHTARSNDQQRPLAYYRDVDAAVDSDDSRMRAARRSLQQYPLNVMVDFTKLRANALRRYMAYHGIQEIPGSSKDQLAVIVARHFSEECKLTDEETSIASFLTYIKGSRSAAEEPNRIARENVLESGTEDRGDKATTEYHHQTSEVDNDEQVRSSGQSSSSSSDDDEPTSHDSADLKYSRSSHPRGSSSSKTNSSNSSHSSSNRNKKKRKTRLYCVCQGASFGNMIACDNKKCLDRSNWFHMACVDLDPTQDPPETWYCPSCVEHDAADVPENLYRKPVASVTYSDMISHALTALPARKGTFKEICDFVEKQYESQLNWKLESDQRKSPVWKSSVRKILFSNMRFRKHPEDKGLFCLAA